MKETRGLGGGGREIDFVMSKLGTDAGNYLSGKERERGGERERDR
jgi:hypothetical protein